MQSQIFSALINVIYQSFSALEEINKATGPSPKDLGDRRCSSWFQVFEENKKPYMLKTVLKKSSHLRICECWKRGRTERGTKSTCKSYQQKRHLVSGCTRSALCLQICEQQRPQGKGLDYHAVAGLV